MSNFQSLRNITKYANEYILFGVSGIKKVKLYILYA